MGIGPSTKETTLHHFKDPLLDLVSKDKDIDLLGIVIVGTPQTNEEKYFVGRRAAALIEGMRADGVIFSLDGWGNSHVDYESWADFSTEFDRPDFEEYSARMERKLNFGSWDPHHEKLIPTIHFYRYDGSLTEPPCGEWVSWFVADKPMTISYQQLEQLKTILFTNYDKNCRKTSAHFELQIQQHWCKLSASHQWTDSDLRSVATPNLTRVQQQLLTVTIVAQIEEYGISDAEQ